MWLDHSEMLNRWFSTLLKLPVLTPRLKPGANRRLGSPESDEKGTGGDRWFAANDMDCALRGRVE